MTTGTRPDPAVIMREFFDEATSSIDDIEKVDYSTWYPNPELQNYSNLPPSLWPITPETVTHSNFATWGQ